MPIAGVAESTADSARKPSAVRAARRPAPELPRARAAIMRMHQAFGNRAVASMLQRRNSPQIKPIVRPPDDAFEQEADRVAEHVTRPAELAPPPRSIQRLPSSSAAPAGTADSDDRVQSCIQESVGRGAALPSPTRASMETQFGADFGKVRVHTGADAANLNRSLHSIAFTTGSDIFFGDGRFQPDSPQGSRLLAHELTHVVQQRGVSGPVIQRKTEGTEQEPGKTTHVVKLVAFAKSLEGAVASVSEDGGAPKQEPVELARNELDPGEYQITFPTGKSGGMGLLTGPALKQPDPPGVKRGIAWHNRDGHLGAAHVVDIVILPGYIQDFLTTNEGGKAKPEDILEVSRAAEILAKTGVTADELLLERQRMDNALRAGRALPETDLTSWSLALAEERGKETATALNERESLQLAAARLARIEPDYVDMVVKHLTDPTLANSMIGVDEIQRGGRSKLFEMGFSDRKDLWTTLDNFANALEFELKALTKATLNSTKVAILRVQHEFVGSETTGVGPGFLNAEIEQAKQDSAVASDIQAVKQLEDHPPPHANTGAADYDEYLDKELKKQHNEKIEAAKKKLGETVSAKTKLKVAGIKGFDVYGLLTGESSKAQSTLALALADGLRTVQSALERIDEPRFVYSADKIITVEKRQLDIATGTTLDRIVDGIVSARLSDKTLFEQIWGIIDLLINIIPIPPPAGVILRAVAAGVNMAMAVDEYTAQSIENQANLSSFAPSSAGLAGTFLLTAAGTVLDASAAKLLSGEQRGLSLGLREESAGARVVPKGTPAKPEGGEPGGGIPSEKPAPPPRPEGESGGIPAGSEKPSTPPKPQSESGGHVSPGEQKPATPPADQPAPPSHTEGTGGTPAPDAQPPVTPQVLEEARSRERLLLVQRENTQRRITTLEQEIADLEDEIATLTEQGKLRAAAKSQNRLDLKRTDLKTNQDKLAGYERDLADVERITVPNRRIPLSWGEHEEMVYQRLVDLNPGKTIGEQVTLDVTNVSTNEKVTIVIDNTVPLGADNYQLVDAKFAVAGDLPMADRARLTETLQPNQRKAYQWVSEGTPVTAVPRGDNAMAAGMTVGRPIRVAPKVQIHVNGPNGTIVVRDY
ncbi:MAG TPA: DUF4157 domain-containing protein [Bryobacteraceae bacterium]|nr:DUF4157 domain-containing protein [Bryobacteraceae bacterium]